MGGNLKTSFGALAALQSGSFVPNMPNRAGTPQKPSGLDAFSKLMKGTPGNAGGQSALMNNFISGKPAEQLEGGRDSKDSTYRAADRRHL